MVTASEDMTAQVWETETGQPLGPVLPHTARIPHACFSGDYPVPVQLDMERVSPKLRLEAPEALSVDIPSAAEMPRTPAGVP